MNNLLNGILGLLLGTILLMGAATSAKTFAEEEGGTGWPPLLIFLLTTVLSLTCFIIGVTLLVVYQLQNLKVL